MRKACSVATVRRAEGGAGVAEPVLMQRAATGLAGLCADLLRDGRGAVRGGRVVGLIGSGNNGGDALWALAFLARRGVRGVALGAPDRMHAPGAEAAARAGVRLLDWTDPTAADELARADLALDGIVGIGGSGGLREPAAGAVRALAAAGVPVVAVDVPSGVDSDTGEVAGEAVRAAATACFGVLKPGLLLTPGRDCAGVVTVMEIGLRPEDLEPAAWSLDLADLAAPSPAPDTHKYRRGVVAVTGGSPSYPGAALLSVGGARRSGAGLVAFRTASAPGLADPVAALVVARYPDVVLTDRAADAHCVGPGLSAGPEATEAVLAALADPAPLVLDASGLDVLATPTGRRALAERSAAGLVTVLTPHSGEAARLGWDASGGRLAAACRAADEVGCAVVAKGAGTVVAAPGGLAFVDTFGSAALATAGSGDVLAGLLAGMLASTARAGDLSHETAALTAARAVGLHGLAGRWAAARIGQPTATDVLGCLPDALVVARDQGDTGRAAADE